MEDRNQHHYWALFTRNGKHIFRYDTRVYLDPVVGPQPADVCIGAVVGKNPGAARQSDPTSKSLQRITLGNDKLLPNVLSIVRKAYERAGRATPAGGYIQVLNLFYLCNPNLSKALKEVSLYDTFANCHTENANFPWVWYVWGVDSPGLTQFKGRFANFSADSHFYYSQKADIVVTAPPGPTLAARHTQGLPHEKVLPFLTELLSRQR